MKRKYRYQAIAGALAMLMIGQATAGNNAGDTTLTLAGAYYHFAPSRHFDNTSMPNVAVAYNFTDRWAIEGDVGGLNTNQKQSIGGRGVHGFLYTVDGIYRCFTHQPFEPYLIAGVGLLALQPSGLNSTHQGNINAGIGTEVFFTKSIALRGEVRDLYMTSGAGKNDYMVNFGVSFLMGGEHSYF